MYVDYEMGNIPPQFSPNVSDVHVDSNRDTVDVAVICEQDYYDEPSAGYHMIREGMYLSTKFQDIKKSIREFIHEVYGYDKICRWTSWDKRNADILPYHLENNDVENVFDVILAVGCPVMLFRQEHVNDMCRLLRPNGLLLISAGRGIDEASTMEMAMRLSFNSIPNCHQNPFVPISRFGVGANRSVEVGANRSVEVWKRSGH